MAQSPQMQAACIPAGMLPHTPSPALSNIPATMLATLYHGPGEPLTFERRETPQLELPTDIIVRVHKTTICGTDLHIRRGAVASAVKGNTLGHECLGHVVAMGSAVRKHKLGDLVLVPCITRCGKCAACAKQFYGHCEEGGWILGHTINGFQTEYARVPHADASCYSLPEGVTGQDEDKYLMLADIMPTGLEIGLMDGDFKEGQTLAVVGCGPVGLSVIIAAVAFYKPSQIFAIDLSESRLADAESMGATHCILNTHDDAIHQVMEITHGVGVDCVVEAIGVPAGWHISQGVVRMGGHIAVLGVHGEPAVINLERMWYRNFKMSAGMVHCYTIQMLMDKIVAGELPACSLISRRMPLSKMMEAYHAFTDGGKGGDEHCLKILITNDISQNLRSSI